MSKERELLERVLCTYSDHNINELYGEIKELLAQPEPDLEALKKDWVNFGYTTGKREQLLVQPEQDPVAWMSLEKGDVNKSRSYFEFVEKYQDENIVPLYTSPPTRKPLSEKQIEYYLERLGSSFKWDDGFKAGVEWAEKVHGITGGSDE
jgi:hypothetical protein